MGELLGPLHHESYAHVNEVKADSYGFGDLTQERRYIARQLEAVRQQEAVHSVFKRSGYPGSLLRCRFA
jgi:4-oxalocrotonate tautomerase